MARKAGELKMKVRDVYEPFNTLGALVSEHGMAKVLQSLSAIAGIAAENVTAEDIKTQAHLTVEGVKTEAERLRFDLTQLSQRTVRFMNGTNEPIDKQGLN
jgi:hypothetical protein